MAQLVKLYDYVSRYENDLSRYPTQFIRLKTQQWERMKHRWESGVTLSAFPQEEKETFEEEEKWFHPFLKLFGSKKMTNEEQLLTEKITDQADELNVDFNFVYQPKTIQELRKMFLDQLFHFQMKWASSTMLESSRVDGRLLRDTLLRDFTQLLPDSYLLFYYPIMKIKKAPVELEIILLTPIECMCLTVLEREEVAAFIGSSERFWLKKFGEQETKVLNPMISLNRMEKIVSSLFVKNEIDFPIKKYVISRNGYIDYPGEPYDLHVVDRRSYSDWFEKMKRSTVPMKFQQFKAAQAIIDVLQTTSMSRFFEPEPDEQEI